MKISLVNTVSFVALALFMIPFFTFAADTNFGAIDEFIVNIRTFINNVLIPLIFAVALLVFIWGMFQYFILGGGDEGKREQGKSLMFWAIIGFVMMVIILAVVNLLAEGIMSGTGTSNTEVDNIPTFNDAP